MNQAPFDYYQTEKVKMNSYESAAQLIRALIVIIGIVIVTMLVVIFA